MEQPQEDSQTPRQDSFSDSAIGTPASSILSTVSIDTATYARIKDGRDCLFPPTLPCNEKQRERWDLLHEVRQRVLGSLILAPTTALDDILDVGTTTGIWAKDAADANPRAHVVGWDKATYLPRWVPPNLDLFQFDYEREWGVYERFDLVNIATPDVHDWLSLLHDSYEALRPGGWLQCTGVVLDPMSDQPEIPSDGHLRHVCGLVREAWRECGVDLDAPLAWRRLLAESGFESVIVQEYKIPCHGWSKDPELKEIGSIFADWLIQEISAAGEYLFEQVEISPQTAGCLLARARREMRDRQHRIHFSLQVHGDWQTSVVRGAGQPRLEDLCYDRFFLGKIVALVHAICRGGTDTFQQRTIIHKYKDRSLPQRVRDSIIFLGAKLKRHLPGDKMSDSKAEPEQIREDLSRYDVATGAERAEIEQRTRKRTPAIAKNYISTATEALPILERQRDALPIGDEERKLIEARIAGVQTKLQLLRSLGFSN